MAAADFEVTLLGGEDSPPGKLYRPGDEVRGSVALFTDSNVKCQHFYIRLGWHTEGRGTRYAEKVSELDVFQGELSSSIPANYNFSFVLPDQPWSYEGHYITIAWAVEFEVDVSWGKNLKHFEPFILSPERKAASSTQDSW